LLGRTYVVEVCYDEAKHSEQRAQNNQILPERVGQVVVHRVDIFGESVNDASKRGGIEKGHGGSQDLPHGLVGHGAAGRRADGGGDERECIEQKTLNHAEGSIYCNLKVWSAAFWWDIEDGVKGHSHSAHGRGRIC
jgi:hypothetical protein